MGVLGIIVLRYRASKNKNLAISGAVSFKCPWYPLPPLFFALVSIIALIYTMITNPVETVIGIFIIGGALGLYPLLKK